LGIILGPAAYHGVVDRYLGLLALALNHPDAAVGHLERAITLLDGFGAKPWAARARFDQARALLRRGAEGDETAVLRLLNDALGDAQEIGMTLLVDDVLPLKLDLQGIGSGS